MIFPNVTIPKKVTKGEELVIITRREYTELLGFKKEQEIREFQPTKAQKQALDRARRNRKSGNFLTFDELKQKLGFTS